MKKLFILFLLPIAMVSCNSSSDEESGPSYEEKAAKAIAEFTKSKDVKDVKKVQEITAKDANEALVKYDSAVVLYDGAISRYGEAIESYQLAKESMSKVDKTFSAYLGSSMDVNYDSLIQTIEVEIEECKMAQEEITLITTQIRSMTDKHKDKSPYSEFSAKVDGTERRFAISPDGDKVKVLFEIN